jgi:hypothetical protein
MAALTAKSRRRARRRAASRADSRQIAAARVAEAAGVIIFLVALSTEYQSVT